MSNKIVVNGVEFTRLAAENIEEVGQDVLEDLQALRSGKLTKETLLGLCLEGVDEDRVEGWRDYVAALILAV